MMLNNLFLNRLIIHTRAREVAYDEIFHKGINIINGDNSSGKSTISHFIFYILGGAFNDWVKEAKQCSSVTAEVEMNGAVITLHREINLNDSGKSNALEPISVYWGLYENSKTAGLEEWQKYPYVTTRDRKSFSNVFFDNLSIPIVKGDNNITMHQILRLLYVDQESPTSSLFFYEPFDTTLTRETVSELLLGIYNQDLYDSKSRKVEVEREFDDAKKEIKMMRQFVYNELDLYPVNIQEKITNNEKKINEIEDDLISLRESTKNINYTKNTKLEFEKLTLDSIKQREIVNELETRTSSLKYEVDDSLLFIETINAKLRAVKNSILTREFLEEFPLDYCPDCLQELKIGEKSHCKLCKEPVDSSYGITQAKKIEQDLSFQIKESTTLLRLKETRLTENLIALESAKANLKFLQQQVNSALKDVKSIRDERIDTLYVEKGYVEGEIVQFRTMLENAERYQNLIAKRDSLASELKLLNAKINKMELDQDLDKISIIKEIEKQALYLLNNDLKRQKDFKEAKNFNIDFRNNIAFISDKEAKYSASSNFYLKTTARFALFLASLTEKKMRYPRFILSDNMEDKGIELIRTHNFQRIIVGEATKHPNEDYQIIYTTSYLPPEFEKSDYLVGEYYTEANPSLKHVILDRH